MRYDAGLFGGYYFAVITVVGFIIFDSTTLSDIPHRLGQLIGIGVNGLTTVSDSFYMSGYAVTLLLALVLSLPVMHRLWDWLCNKISSHHWLCIVQNSVLYVWCLAVLLVSTAYLIDGSYNPFLYFRF